MHPEAPKMPRVPSLGVAAAAVVALIACVAPSAHAQWTMVDFTAAAGLSVSHSVDTLSTLERETITGAASADYNGDGWLDLYFCGGNNSSHNYLFRNNGDGTFSDVAAAAGVDLPNSLGSGPCFCDWDGDGDPDLFVGGIESTDPSLFRNEGNGTFTDVTSSSGVTTTQDTFSASFADYNGDQWLDLFLTHWRMSGSPSTEHVYRNNGDGTFSDVDGAVGYTGFPPGTSDHTFSYNMADIDDDGDADMLCASDFLTSHVYRNDGGSFVNITDTGVITDQNGMGSSVGDYDEDGDLDWFVSSIFNLPQKNGNRLYRNDGGGVFANVTTTAGVSAGSWGWGATFQDFDLNGHLDIYHVNGWRNGYSGATSKMFRSNGNGTFTEVAGSAGCNHNGEGRGVVAFDYDKDGDLDLFLANNDEPAVFYRSFGLTNNWLTVKLVGPSPNTEQVGARVKVTIGATTQMREIRCGSNFVSQDPVMAHFGLLTSPTIDTLEVEWASGGTTTMNSVSANQHLVLSPSGVSAPVLPPSARGSVELLGAAPNPFGSKTTVRFRLGVPGEVDLRVFDATGRAVRTVDGGRRAAGEYAISWDGRDDSGRAAGAGIYYYEVRTAAGSATGKLTLLR